MEELRRDGRARRAAHLQGACDRRARAAREARDRAPFARRRSTPSPPSAASPRWPSTTPTSSRTCSCATARTSSSTRSRGATGASLDLPDIAAGAIEKLRRAHALRPRPRRAAARRAHLRRRVRDRAPRPEPIPDDHDDRRSPTISAAAPREELVITLTLPDDAAPRLRAAGRRTSSARRRSSRSRRATSSSACSASAPSRPDAFDARRPSPARAHRHSPRRWPSTTPRFTSDIKHMHLSNLKALSSALNAKDYYTLGHAARVAAYMVLLGEELGWPAGPAPAGRRGGLPARHRQDRRVRPRAAQAERPERARSGSSCGSTPSSAPTSSGPLFDDDAGAGRAPPSRALRGRRLPGRPRRRGHPPHRPRDVRRRLLRRHVVPAPLPSGAVATRSASPSCERCRGTQFDPDMVDAFLRVLNASGRRPRACAQGGARPRPSRVDRGAARAAARPASDEGAPGVRGTCWRRSATVCAAQPADALHHAATCGWARRPSSSSTPARTAPASPTSATRWSPTTSSSRCFAGRDLDANVLFVDQWGVWISGTAPRAWTQDGRVVAAVTADIPATEGIGGDRGSAEQRRADLRVDAAHGRRCRRAAPRSRPSPTA